MSANSAPASSTPAIVVFAPRERARVMMRSLFPRRRTRLVLSRTAAGFEQAFRDTLVDAAIVDVGAAATIPGVRKCMLCHAKIATAKPEIQKLAAFAKNKREIPWQRVYGFPGEALVKFQHAPHTRAKIDCAVCHGNMAQATTAERLVNHNMGTCLSCHRQYQASEDCAAI